MKKRRGRSIGAAQPDWKRELDALAADYQLSERQYAAIYTKLLLKPRQLIPVSIFSTNLPPLQTLVYFLHTYWDMQLKQIAQRLARDYQTIWITWKQVKGKPWKLPVAPDHCMLLSEFSDRRYSILECVVAHLRAKKLRYREIGQLLQRNERTIWTVYQRWKKKLAEQERQRRSHVKK